MKIHFIRHGETAYKWITDIVIWEAIEFMLNDRWVIQCRDLRDLFIKENTIFDVIVSSTTPRAVQSAEIMFPWREIILAQGLRAKSSGEWEGKLKTEVFTQEYLNNIYDFVPPSWESYSMVNDRAKKWYYDFTKKNAHLDRIAVVSHDFAMKCLFCHFFEIPWKYIESLKINNVGQMIIEVNEKKIKLIHWN